MRIKGHFLDVRWNGEYGAESGSTGTCPCGWSESASSQREVRREYQFHLEAEAKKLEKKAEPSQSTVVGLSLSAGAANASVKQANLAFAQLADAMAQGRIGLTDYQRGLIAQAVKDLKEVALQSEGLLTRIVRVVK